MKCQICNKNEANIIFTQIVNNEKIVMQICSECARKKGLTMEIKKVSPLEDESLFGSIAGDIVTKNTKSVPDLTCGVCGLTFAEFKKTGLFGCDKCHEAFDVHVTSLLKHIHGAATHEGKTPVALSGEIEKEKELKKLRSKLKRHVELEEYEKAAEIRDRIAALEQMRKGKKNQSDKGTE